MPLKKYTTTRAGWWVGRPRRSTELGAAAVELAMVLPLFLALVLGILTGGIAMDHKIGVTNAAREAARYGAIVPASQCADTTKCGGRNWAQLVQAVAGDRLSGEVPASQICVALVSGPGSQSAGAKPGSMGSLPAGAAPPSAAGDPRAQYDAAMELLSKAQYSEAQSSFRSFVLANPSNELAGPAQYWVGDIWFTQKDYSNAAKAFADVLKRFSRTTKAPDAMLKLGLSLMELGQKNEACTTLGALKAKYPNANAGILSRAAQRAKEAKCA